MKFSRSPIPVECSLMYWGVHPLPRRSTSKSAGYDFFMSYQLVLEPGEHATIDTGILIDMDDDCFLTIVPRSSLGIKGMVLLNTIGIIDADYKDTIKVMVANYGTENLNIEKGARVVQGIISRYLKTEDDEPGVKWRHGGLGSTGK